MLLLASQLLHVGLENIPPVTLAVLGLNVYLYMFPAVPLLQVKHISVFVSNLKKKTKTNTYTWVDMMAQWLVRHSKKVVGSNPGLGFDPSV